MEIEYQHQDDHGDLPSQWKTSKFDRAGNLSLVCTSTVQSWEVNQDIDESKFDIIFPSRCAVVNNDTGEYFIAMPSGALRPVSLEELSSGISYDELVEKPLNNVGVPKFHIMVVVNVALIALITILILARRRVKRT